jgi:hypothetical protein
MKKRILKPQISNSVSIKFIEPLQTARNRYTLFTLSLTAYEDAKGLKSLFVNRNCSNKTFDGDTAGATFGTAFVRVGATIPADIDTGNWYVKLVDSAGNVVIDTMSDVNFKVI